MPVSIFEKFSWILGCGNTMRRKQLVLRAEMEDPDSFLEERSTLFALHPSLSSLVLELLKKVSHIMYKDETLHHRF